MATPVDSIKFPVAIDEGRGRLALERDYSEHVKQLIRQILLTSPGERINLPTLGAGLRRAVFAPNSDATASLVQTLIVQNLTEFLGSLIRVEEVIVEARDELLSVTITYILFRRQERQFLNLEVTL